MTADRDMGPHPMPAAEVNVSPGLVRRLLAAQHPDLAPLRQRDDFRKLLAQIEKAP